VGLDSIDALEIGAAIRKKYQVKFKANSEENREHFRSISTLAAFVAANADITIES
jgi:acyl carrier protein